MTTSVGVPGASNAFASALWALDHLHWWAAHGAAGVNFHNRRGLCTATIVPDPAGGGGYVINPKGYGIKAFTLGSAGQVKPTQIHNPGGINLTAYCVGGAGEDYVTIINKAHGAGPRGCRRHDRPAQPGAAGRADHDSRRRGSQETPGGPVPRSAAPRSPATPPGTANGAPCPPTRTAGISLTVKATTAAIVKIHARAVISIGSRADEIDRGGLRRVVTDRARGERFYAHIS